MKKKVPVNKRAQGCSSSDRVSALREWYLDNASNVYVTSDLRYFIEYEPFLDDAQTKRVRGFQSQFMTKPIGLGTVQGLVQNPKGSRHNIITLYDVCMFLTA